MKVHSHVGLNVSEILHILDSKKKKKKKERGQPLRTHNVIFFFLLFLRAAPAAYGNSQARAPIGAAAAGLRQNHSNEGSEPRLQPTPQLMATLDP